MSMRKIINNSINAKSTPTDILTYGKDKYCINVLNMGFDAMIAKNIDKFRKVPLVSGSTKYNMSIIYTLSSSKNFKFKINCNEKILKNKFTLIAIANGKFYGGGIIPCPNAKVNDNIMDCCIIQSTDLLDKLKLLPKYKKGTHENISKVEILKTKEIKIVSTRQFPVSSDGEVFYTNRLHVKILPKSINIVYIN